MISIIKPHMCTLICPHNQTKETSQCHCKIYFITLTLLLLRERPRGNLVINANLSHHRSQQGLHSAWKEKGWDEL